MEFGFFLRAKNSCLTGSLQQTTTVRMEETGKKRSPNFSPQDCLLLAEIMGEIHPDFTDLNLSFHKVDKHRFNSRITSSMKKAVWRTVAEKFKSKASLPREATVLQKKWDNMVTKHRNIYSDFKRTLSLTGRGPTGFSLSVLTDAVMNVIGKESVSVVGAGGDSFDSAINVVLSQQSEDDTNTQNVFLLYQASCLLTQVLHYVTRLVFSVHKVLHYISNQGTLPQPPKAIEHAAPAALVKTKKSAC